MINNKKVEKKLNNIPFLSPCCTLLTRCPVPIFWEIKTSHRLKKRATAREKRQKVECGKEELQSKAGYRKKVEFVTKQRKGWCFFVLHSAWFLSLFFLFFLDHSRIFGCGSVSSWCCQNLDIFLCLTFCCIK